MTKISVTDVVAKKDQKFREDGLELDDDGWGEEKETVEEIY